MWSRNEREGNEAAFINLMSALKKLNYGSIHFPFVLSAARCAVYRRNERETLTTNGNMVLPLP